MEKPAAATERVAVFVDGANLYHAIKSYYRGVLDYGVLLGAAVAGRKLLRATFYIVEKHEAEEGGSGGASGARSFVYNLNRFGYKVRSKPLVAHETVTPDGEKIVTHKGDWDMGIVVDMVRLADLADAYVPSPATATTSRPSSTSRARRACASRS
jgi:uncharacterized LabA/DUF88 family protein